MASLFRWTVRIVAGVMVLAVLALLVVYYFAQRSIPDYDVTRPARGISAPLEIVRDHAQMEVGATDQAAVDEMYARTLY